jgi:hypothetical protein
VTARYPVVVLTLDAAERADVVALSMLVAEAMRRANVPPAQIGAYLAEAGDVLRDPAASLEVARRWVTIVVRLGER